jgi:TetR/AcrR family transcriptional regulator, tetracycline repressor protein
VTPRRPRAARHTLDRDTIAAAALELMDTLGAAALTIRSLAAKLGVAPMALYNHVTTKDDILDAAREWALRGLDGVEPGDHDQPWWERVRRINLAFLGALRRHPSLVQLLVSRPLAGQAAIGAAEAQLRVLIEAGFAPEEAARAHLALLQYGIGHAAWTGPRIETVAASQAALSRLPADRYPTLSKLAEPLAAATHDERQYAYGLDLLLASLRAGR